MVVEHVDATCRWQWTASDPTHREHTPLTEVQFFPYQVEGIVRAYRAMIDPSGRGAFYLQWKPGMGKTLGAIALHRKLSERTVVV